MAAKQYGKTMTPWRKREKSDEPGGGRGAGETARKVSKRKELDMGGIGDRMKDLATVLEEMERCGKVFPW